MEIWQQGTGKQNLQVDGVNCKHMTGNVVPWFEGARDVQECS